MAILQISENVILKILEEEKNYDNKEFGGYLVVKNNIIKDVVFDVATSNYGYVKFDLKNIIKLPAEKQKYVRGWMHSHPITGWSGLDQNTMMNLTKFWGECHSVVLQQPTRKLLLTKTIFTTNFPVPYPIFAVVNEYEIDLHNYKTNPMVW